VIARRCCHVVLALALFGGMLLAPPLARGQDARVGFRAVQGSLVIVNAWATKTTRIGYGSGFVVQSNATQTYILTARHVIKDAAILTIDLLGLKTSKNATVVSLGVGNREDLALLIIPQGNLPAVTFDAEVPEVGQPLAAAGFPKAAMDLLSNGLGLSPLLGIGMVSSLPEDRQLMTLANIAVQEGLSGGPVFDPATGQIVGIVDTQLPNEAVTGIAIGTRVMLPFLNKKLNGVHVDRHDQLALSAAPAAVAVAPAPPTPRPPTPPPATPAAVALATPAPVHVADPTIPVRSAEIALAAGRYDVALNAVKSALNVDPKFPRAWLDMGLIFFRTNHLDAATTAFTRALTYDPEYALAYNNRGYSYGLAGKYAPAIADFGHAIALDPKNAHAYTNRGTIYLDAGQPDAAMNDFNQAIALDPTNPITYNNRGNAYVTKNDLAAATADYNKALGIDPRYSRAYLGLGTIALQQQQFDAAIAAYTKSIGIDPKNTKAYSNRAAAYALSGQYAQAIADCNQALAIDPKNAYAYYYRGLSNFKTGQAAAAATDYQQASTLAPQQQWAAYR
jgi:tetratricopeptide (TPR) repeat protein